MDTSTIRSHNTDKTELVDGRWKRNRHGIWLENGHRWAGGESQHLRIIVTNTQRLYMSTLLVYIKHYRV